jgi:hypothetical protein
MCLMVLALDVVDGYPLFVAALRDENRDRPSVPPHFVPPAGSGLAALAPRDLSAGGTWMGVNEHGLVAALINRREAPPPENPVSRGQLCCEVLRAKTLDEAIAAGETLLLSGNFAGCNLVIASRHRARVLEWTGRLESFPHTAGVQVISNESVRADASARGQFVKMSVQNLGSAAASWMQGVPALLRTHATETTPDVCLHRGQYGTVSMSVIALGDEPSQAVYAYTPGPPCRTVALDYSRELQSLLAVR